MRTLHAELTKLTIGYLPAIVVATIALSWATEAAVGQHTPDPAKTALSGVLLGQAVVAVFGVMSVTGEYATGLIHVSLAATPRRWPVLAAKAAVLVTAVSVAGTAAVAGCALLHHLPWRPAVGSVLYLDLIALLALGIGTAVRDSATAVGTVLALLYLFPILGTATSDPTWRRHLDQIGPMSAGTAIQATTDLAHLPIGPWPGLGVLALWTLGALTVGGVLLQTRDV